MTLLNKKKAYFVIKGTYQQKVKSKAVICEC